jgi:hypothetical protein
VLVDDPQSLHHAARIDREVLHLEPAPIDVATRIAPGLDGFTEEAGREQLALRRAELQLDRRRVRSLDLDEDARGRTPNPDACVPGVVRPVAAADDRRRGVGEQRDRGRRRGGSARGREDEPESADQQ